LAIKYWLYASKLDFNNITVDPVVYTSGYLSSMKFDMTAGLYLYSQNYFFGLSAQQIVPSRIDFSNNYITTSETGKTVPHIFVTAGYRFRLSEEISALPSLMIKYITPAIMQAEVNGKLQFRNLFWIGSSYRQNDSFAGMIGFNISSKFNISYSYDHTISTLNTYSGSTHEVVVGYSIGNSNNTGCPLNLW